MKIISLALVLALTSVVHAVTLSLSDGYCTNGEKSVSLEDWDAEAMCVTIQLDTTAIANAIAESSSLKISDLFTLQKDGQTIYQFGLSGSSSLTASFTNIAGGNLGWANSSGSEAGAPTLEALSNASTASITLVVGYYNFGVPKPTGFFGALTLGDGTSYYMTGSAKQNFSNIDAITALTVNDDYVTEGWIQEIDPSKGGYPAYGPVIDEMNKEANAYLPAPEPTTATLSLLALAGLAARRRRK